MDLFVDSLVVKDHAGTANLAQQLAAKAFPGMVLLLSGDLGSGKTTFMQSFGRGLGITEPITSPTFTLIDEYHEGRLPLYHMDLYRLEPEQTKGLHLAMYWQGDELPPGVVAIEWAERLSNLPAAYLPATYLRINIKVVEDEDNPASDDDGGVEAQTVLNKDALSDDLIDDVILDLPQGRVIELIGVGHEYKMLMQELIS
ncbi:MAG: tRNA (adenosine(37)-N6)-threonylcarbamoyltransferase complex ATPase subunit type 1 TsaE [Pseudanabaenaceae cyanobacterium]